MVTVFQLFWLNIVKLESIFCGALLSFLTSSGSGRKWTISKHFRTRLRLYLMSLTIDQINENAS